MNSKINKILGLILILVWAGLILEGLYIYSKLPKPVQPSQSEKEEPASKKEQEMVREEKPAKPDTLPKSVNLEIPFTSQAPLGDWSPPFNHTCEEAAILMVHYYFKNKKVIDPAAAKIELLDIVDFEMKNYGFHEDTSTAQTAQLIKDYYGYKAKVFYDISLQDIKNELALNNPVIVPVAGRLLENPYFTPPGPIYHMLLIKGYNQDGFIANDAGTKMGDSFLYSYETLEKAINDWDSKKGLENNKKAMIVIYPPK